MDLVPYIFHEQQEGNLCAQHCLNALLQGPYFTAIDLAELARQLDQQEDEALGNSGSSNRNNKSQNMDDSGFFSVQVLSHALSIWNTQIIPWGAKEVSIAKSEPEREVAFICNLDEHWYTLRRFGPSVHRWYDLNSMHSKPRHMSSTYLGMTLSQLEAEGYSIFVVRPLSKDTGQPPSIAETKVQVPEIKPVEPSTPVLTGFLSERQEMERIRRQRLEEREKARQVSSGASSTQPASDESQSQSSRTRIDRDGEELSSKPAASPLVKTPTFLPRSEADTIAETLPTENVQSSQSAQAQDQTFGGTGYRLGGQATSASGGSTDFGDFGGYGDTEQFGDGEAEWDMVQQAIALSLQQEKK
ncbi:Ataxin-3 [Podila minutissima]|nr:Ataxin-3 [Podila minutissima]